MDAQGPLDDRFLARVRTWLAEQGLPLEMDVAEVLSSAGFDVVQSAYYLDLTLRKHREIDVVGTRFLVRSPREVSFGYSFVVECKLSQRKPWLLLQGRNLKRWSRIGDPRWKNISTPMADKLLSVQQESVDYDSDGIIFGPESTAFSCVTCFKQGRQPDPAYRAMLTACKAAVSDRASGGAAADKYCHVWIPLVVLDGVLIEIEKRRDDQLNLRKVPWGRVLFRQPDAGGRTIVDIVTAVELPRYVNRARRELDALIGGQP